ncbi:MAG: hypothetical protein KTR30_27595 [Saprospiraceae bacterium]|nr:hypothetical protein [Saprospiraceae bacterium]
MNEENQYKAIEKALAPHQKLMEQAADTILDQEVSAYPIFIIHQLNVEIGVILVSKEEGKAEWSVHASTLEELVTKQIIQMDKVDNFRQVYKDPREHLCLFTLSEMGATFIFLPRTMGKSPENG